MFFYINDIIFLKEVKILSSVELVTIILSSAAIAISLINICIKFVWDDTWKRFCNKIYKNLGKLNLKYNANGYGQKEFDKKLMFLEIQQCINLFYTICSTFLEERRELFVNNKINRKKLNAYVLNFKWVIEFLIESKGIINPIEETLKTKQLNYKFKSYFLMKAPDQMPNIDEDDTQIWQASRKKRRVIQNIIRLKELTFDEVMERVEAMAQIDIEIITDDFLRYQFVDKISFFNDEEVCKKYSFNYFYDKFYKEFKVKVLDFENTLENEDIVTTTCIEHGDDYWIPLKIEPYIVNGFDKMYWNINHYSEEGNKKVFLLKDNKIYDETLKQDINSIYINRTKNKDSINKCKLYCEMFGKV
jgi:hypothetical protein